MTIHLPEDLERSIQAAVHSGHFASADDALIAAAVRPSSGMPPTRQPQPGIGSIGAMRDAADEMDEIVADAMKQRREENVAGYLDVE